MGLFPNLPGTLAHCQKWETFPEEAPCRFTTFDKMPKIFGTLPKVPYLSLPGPNRTYLTLVPKVGPDKAHFH